MAISPAATYPSQIDTTDPTGYPYGKAKNVLSIGDGTGTPLERVWVSDLFGFEQALLAAAGIVPSGVPDKVGPAGASQYLDAIKFVSRREAQKAQALNWPERASVHDAGDYSFPNGPLDIAWAPDLGAGGGGRYVMIAPGNVAGMQTWSSEDGNQWAYGGLNSAAHSCVAYGRIGGASGFLMTFDSPVGYYTSLTGTSWGTVSATMPVRGIACWAQSLGLWVIAGESGAISTSPTGLAGSWTARTTPAAWQSNSGGVKRVVFANGLFVILPLASPGGYTKCLTSSDAVTWTERALGSNQLWVGLAWSAVESKWMSVSDGGYVATSSDGLTWSSPATLGYGFKDLSVNGSLFVASTRNAAAGGITFSTDGGATWTPVNCGDHRVATAGWGRIILADSRLVVAHSTGAATEVALSERAR